MEKVIIEIGDLKFTSTFSNNETAKAIIKDLPFTGTASVWGKEIYFYFDTIVPLSNESRDVLEVGELGYWPSGPAFCIFFGPTPASHNNEPRAASNVNVFGKIDGNIDQLEQIKDGSPIKVYK